MRQLSTIWQYRHFWLSLVSMDLRFRYRRSILGVGWSLLNPILMTLVFCVVFAAWQPTNDWRNYAPSVLGGLAIWEFIKSSTLAGCQTFFRNEAYIRQCPLPLSIYHIRNVLGTTIHFLIAFGVLVTLITAIDRTDNFKALKMLWVALPGIILLVLLCWSLSVLAGFMTVYFQDAQYLLEVFFQIFFFLTPIMYPIQMLHDRGLSWLASLSPVVTFFELVREPLLTGQVPIIWAYSKAIIMILFFFSCAVAITAWLERRLIFHL